jgi:hypothetical protein
MGKALRLQNIGQIKDADIHFGDLTVFVGPQATGKSIHLQFLKLLADTGYIQSELKRHGIDWGRRLPDFFDTYFGEGMREAWKVETSKVTWAGQLIDMPGRIGRQQVSKTESVFFVPAQRVLALRDGWPRPFTDFKPGDPFVVRQFSERLRLLMETEISSDKDVFPQKQRLREVFRELLSKAVFGDFTLKVDRHLSQKRFMLGGRGGNGGLPFMVWSAGQREFMPLLLAFYWLMPAAGVSRRDDIEWVVIEEPEMGLHTQAISTVLLMTLGLVQRGYRVCLSTHSPYVLDAVWALNELKTSPVGPGLFREIFDAPKDELVYTIAEAALKKETKVYYFDRVRGEAKDISNLDPGAVDETEAGWGGLGEFSGRVADVVARAVSERK